MKRLLVLTSLFMILTSFDVSAENKPQPKMFDTQAQGQEAAADKKKFIIHMKDGGSMETTNYTYENGKVKIMLENGSVSFDKSMITKIEEIKGEEGETVQREYNQPSEKQGAARPPVSKVQETASPFPQNQVATQPTDDNGHNESWWKAQVNLWKKKLADAQVRFEKAQNDWNRYNGLVGTLPGTSTNPTATDYQATQYQDLRGSSRVAMDQAQADMDEAKKMLEEGLPDQARKAGAPPGWAR